jgi:prepilin-type N-terminal cleavage/methylation domain-containing protein
MKCHSSSRHRAFTLIETVIAIGVLAVLLTGFMMVFAPAAAGIRKSLNVQEADRLASTLEQELVTRHIGLDTTTYTTGFSKAFAWIKSSSIATDALLVYQYRGSLATSTRADGTPLPVPTIGDLLPGKDYSLVPRVRRKSDANFLTDLAAVEGGVYLVKCTQLIFSSGQLKQGTAGTIVDPKGVVPGPSATADAYPEAVIAFSADFYTLPAKSSAYFSSGFSTTFIKTTPTGPQKPVFTRNLAVRR